MMSTARQSGPEAMAESLHSAAIHLLRKLRRADARSGLNGPRLSALSVIVFGGPLTLGRLAEVEQVKPPTMTRIVNALEGKGLVRKVANPSDRRTIHLSATMKGKRVMLEARERRVRSLAEGIGELSEGRQQKLRAAIGIIEGIVRGL